MFGPGNAQLPAPPMLMMDRIVEITADGGKYGKGFIHAELEIDPRALVLPVPLPRRPRDAGKPGRGRPVAAGGLLPRLVGGPGRGRALGAGEVKFRGQVRPTVKRITYKIDMKRVIMRRLILGIGDGTLEADGKVIYTTKDLKVGLFSPEALQGVGIGSERGGLIPMRRVGDHRHRHRLLHRRRPPRR